MCRYNTKISSAKGTVAHSLIGRMYSSLGSVAEVSFHSSAFHTSPHEADVMLLCPLASGWAGSLGAAWQESRDRREEGGRGRAELALTWFSARELT